MPFGIDWCESCEDEQMDNMPDTYMVVDVETTDKVDAFVVQFGAVFVVNGKIDENRTGSIMLQLPDDVWMAQGAFDKHGLSRNFLNANGMAPREAMTDIREIMANPINPILGQNVIFDLQAINYTLNKLNMEIVDFSKRFVIDAGLVYKADLMEEVKRPEESMYTFLRRIKETPRRGLYWRLDVILKQAGINVASIVRHSAEDDARLTHLVYQWMRKEGYYERVLDGKRSNDRSGPGVQTHGPSGGQTRSDNGRIHTGRGDLLPY